MRLTSDQACRAKNKTNNKRRQRTIARKCSRHDTSDSCAPCGGLCAWPCCKPCQEARNKTQRTILCAERAYCSEGVTCKLFRLDKNSSFPVLACLPTCRSTDRAHARGVGGGIRSSAGCLGHRPCPAPKLHLAKMLASSDKVRSQSPPKVAPLPSKVLYET